MQLTKNFYKISLKTAKTIFSVKRSKGFYYSLESDSDSQGQKDQHQTIYVAFSKMPHMLLALLKFKKHGSKLAFQSQHGRIRKQDLTQR